jgi:hypothetical protein
MCSIKRYRRLDRASVYIRRECCLLDPSELFRKELKNFLRFNIR